MEGNMGRYESPEYKVIMSEDDFEIRDYDDFYVVEYDNESDPEINRGFATLFSYISDNNKIKQKISMTVPVIEEISQNKKKMAFVVPGKFKDNIPEPNDKNLSVKEFNKGRFAVIRYSGLSNENKEYKMMKKLNDWLNQNDYVKQSKFMLAFYNAPFTPPMLRRNEIMVRIANS